MLICDTENSSVSATSPPAARKRPAFRRTDTSRHDTGCAMGSYPSTLARPNTTPGAEYRECHMPGGVVGADPSARRRARRACTTYAPRAPRPEKRARASVSAYTRAPAGPPARGRGSANGCTKQDAARPTGAGCGTLSRTGTPERCIGGRATTVAECLPSARASAV
jgi:hypothetical protein